jgi:hypothetical protein
LRFALVGAAAAAETLPSSISKGATEQQRVDALLLKRHQRCLDQQHDAAVSQPSAANIHQR